jgi:hypothetical protein
MSNTERIKAACIAGAKACEAGLPEEPPKGLSSLEYASWRIGYAGTAKFEEPEPDDEPELPNTNWRTSHHYEIVQQIREMKKRFEREHKRQPGEGGWVVLMHPAPKHAAEVRAFVERYHCELEEIAEERGRNGKALTVRATYALAILGRIKKPQFTSSVDRTHAVTTEWLVEAGWTPVKDKSKTGNAWRAFWTADGRQGRVNVFASPDGWKVRFAVGDSQHYAPETFRTAAAAYTAVHMHVNLEPPALEEDWRAP